MNNWTPNDIVMVIFTTGVLVLPVVVGVITWSVKSILEAWHKYNRD